LCQKGHENPRGADFFAICGSRNLSNPHSLGRVPLWVLTVFGLPLQFVVLMGATGIYILIYIRALIQNPSGLLPLMLTGFVLGLFWLLWMSGHDAARHLFYGSDTDKRR